MISNGLQSLSSYSYTCTYLGTDGALSGRDGTPGTGRDGRDGGVGFAPEEGRGGAVCLEFL